MSNTKIAEFEVGRPTEGTFMLVRKARRLNRNGEPFLALELSDDSGTIEARVWDNADWFDRQVQVGDEVTAIGKPSTFRDSVQFDVRRIHRSDDPSGASFVPATGRPLDDLAGEIDFLIGEVADPKLRALAEAVWMGPDRELLLRSPATESAHHAYLGGLVEHTLAVTVTCQAYCDRYPQLNHDVLLTAALLHDIGRADELSTDGHIAATPEGRLVGHELLAHERVLAAGAQTGADKHAKWHELLHAISRHHGPADRCQTREAMVLAAVNSLDARLGGRLSGPSA